MEKTLVLIKPDAMERKIAGEIISRFEKKGFMIQAMKMVWLDREDAAAHYAEHHNKPFYSFLLEYITRLPIIAMVIAGSNAVEVVRTMVGATDPEEAAPGTIRGDLALKMRDGNVVHASDSLKSAEREIALFFDQNEIYDYEISELVKY